MILAIGERILGSEKKHAGSIGRLTAPLPSDRIAVACRSCFCPHVRLGASDAPPRFVRRIAYGMPAAHELTGTQKSAPRKDQHAIQPLSEEPPEMSGVAGQKMRRASLDGRPENRAVFLPGSDPPWHSASDPLRLPVRRRGANVNNAERGTDHGILHPSVTARRTTTWSCRRSRIRPRKCRLRDPGAAAAS